MALNPHFDDNELVWRDEFSGRYQPPPESYYSQFDDKWRLVLEDDTGAEGFNAGLGVKMDDSSIRRLVYEWTGEFPSPLREGKAHVRRAITENVPEELIRDKKCLDAGCGMGRWTRVMQMIGAREVLSVDVSEHSLESVRRFNDNVLSADLTQLTTQHSELVGQFDFANLWGVAHHTHDPRETFRNVAAAVKPGGSMYVMLYDTAGAHNTSLVNGYRRTFANLNTAEERLEFATAIAERRWHKNIPLKENVKNFGRKLLRRGTSKKIGILDQLMPFYNWTVPIEVATNWMTQVGFESVQVLNPDNHGQSSRHYLATNKRVPKGS
ncbi:MAG: class I SAM-dependent methyltransferase [Pseudomonadota bacterium]